MKALLVPFAGLLVALTATPAWSAGPLQRFALVIGANSGGGERVQLRYAVSDADHFARVLRDLGGVTASHEIVLRQPKLRELLDAFDTLTRSVDQERRAGNRTEFVLYYSGHADETGLLFGGDRYSYSTLRERLALVPADVRIAILDACSSGSFTRLKSGKPRPPFLVDESSAMRGHAFLTSSAESEAAQESDRIRGSYFTHYLLSGFRGAADLSGDGKVTLNEAYQFAFNETLGKTIDTKAGAQHPSYDINMSGTGDVVMTDVRQTNATMVLGEDLEGRFFIRTAAQELVVELYKPRGRRVELAVEPGTYEVRIEKEKEVRTARAVVAADARVVLDPYQFGAAAPAEATRRRGPEPGRYAVTSRNRFDLRVGSWVKSDNDVRVSAGEVGLDVYGGIGYTRYMRENLAATFFIDGFAVDSGSTVGANGVGAGDVAGSSISIGLRWNPLRGNLAAQPLKPFVGIAFGPVFGVADGSFRGRTITAGSTVRSTLGTFLSAGFDVHTGRTFAFGVNAGYNVMPDFSEPVGLRDNFNGPQITVSIGWLFGKGI